jgi:hypothetical protein
MTTSYPREAAIREGISAAIEHARDLQTTVRIIRYSNYSLRIVVATDDAENYEFMIRSPSRPTTDITFPPVRVAHFDPTALRGPPGQPFFLSHQRSTTISTGWSALISPRR